jgi:signal transduction histidine kinase
VTPGGRQIAWDLCREDLFERLGWLIRLRWLAAAGLLTVILFARYGLWLAVSLPPLLAMNAVLVLCNVAYLRIWHRWEHEPLPFLVRLGIVQMVMDFVILTILLHYAGGIENPFRVTFVFQCTIASMLFTPALSYLLAAFAVALASGMVTLEHYGLWPHHHLEGYLPAVMPNGRLYIAGALASLTMTLFVSVYLTTTIERAYRRRRSEAQRQSRELEQARDQMQQADKMAALGELAASMAHDINNPAGVLCTRLEIMQAEGAFDNLPDRTRHDLSTLQECAQYLRRVAENWTQFARKSPTRLGHVDLNDAVHRTAAMVAESLLSHHVRFDVQVDAHPLWVRGDLVRLQQVILNLINNARDAMPEGGVLTIRTRALAGSNGAPGAVVEVEDSGTGIAPEDLDRIFQPFFSKKPNRQGTGLGLAICQKIVKEMEGEIRVRSEAGKGAVFSIHLTTIPSPKRSTADVRN